jgi:AcrR family transcriptional regulator
MAALTAVSLPNEPSKFERTFGNWDTLFEMATRPDRPLLGARYDARRAELLKRAARVFAEEGYENTSMAELARRLELATGAIYHYFPGKEELLIAICDQLTAPLLAEASATTDGAGAPEAELRLLLRLWLAHLTSHRDHALVFQQVRHEIDQGAQWRGVREARTTFERLLDRTLERALESRPADRRLTLYALLGMVNHTVQWYRPRGRLSSEAIADGYADLVLGSS